MAIVSLNRKKCSCCKEIKNLSDFYGKSTTKDKLCSYCKVCDLARSKAYREKNKEKLKEYSKKYYQKNKAILKEKQKLYAEKTKGKTIDYKKKWREENSEKEYFYNLKGKYGITEEQLEHIKNSFNYSCMICGIEEKDLERKLCIDHNHTNNQVRGVLCSSCNLGIGNFKDDINLIEKAIQYLDQYDVGFFNKNIKKLKRKKL